MLKFVDSLLLQLTVFNGKLRTRYCLSLNCIYYDLEGFEHDLFIGKYVKFILTFALHGTTSNMVCHYT